MDRLIAFPVELGQPLRSIDWEMMQNVSRDTIASIIKAFTNVKNVILNGCSVSINGGKIYLTEGTIYVDGEIYFVSSCNFNIIEEKQIYFKPDFSTTELRTFKDTSTHEVYSLRRYTGGFDFSDVIPDGAILYSQFQRLSDIHLQTLLANISSSIALTSKASVNYNTGFSSATAFPYAKVTSNNFNLYMFTGAFRANTSYGKLCTLPESYRPSGDFFGVFWLGGGLTGTIRLKKNGEVWIDGASTTSINYVSLLFPKQFDDPVNYDTPTGEGTH